MKSVIRLIYLTVFAVFFSCNDMLEQYDPARPTGDTFLRTEQELKLAVTSVYGGLTFERTLYGGYIVGLEMLSDNIYTGSSIEDGVIGRWSNFSFDPSDAGVESFYTSYYRAIARANSVLANADRVQGISEDKLNNYLGQVRFIRGFTYFMLTLTFGDAPIITEPVTDPTGISIAKSPAADLYNLAIEDLKFAESVLPMTQPDRGRISKMVATAMLAKVYLFGADELGENSWYQLAQQKANEVIQSGAYSLYNSDQKTPLENLIDIVRLENQLATGKEEIFYIHHFNNGGAFSDADVATEVPMQLNPRFNRTLNVWGYGWGYVYEANLSIWEPGDARRNFNLWLVGEPIVLNGVQRGTYRQTGHPRPNVKADGSAVQKYWYAETFKSTNGRSNQNIPVMRYADLLLMHAEADLMADGVLSESGLASLNSVRNRAGLPSLEAAAVDRATILQERRVELFAEFHRWFDLMRTRTAEQAFARLKAGDTNNNDNEKVGFSPARNYKLPIPQAAIDRNSRLEQHPAWSGQ